MKANYTRVKSGGKKSWNTGAFNKGSKQGWQKSPPAIPKSKQTAPISGSMPQNLAETNKDE